MDYPNAAELFVWYVVPVVLLALFFLVFKRSKTTLVAGLLLSLAVISLLGILMLQLYLSDIVALRVIMAVLAILIILLMSYGVYVLIAVLVLNTRDILRRERRSLQHALTLILALALLLFVIITRFIDFSLFPLSLQFLAYALYGLIIYYFLHLFVFVISVLLANCARPQLNQDYLIILGAWVKDGKVPPLLAKRIDKAIEFYQKQKEQGSPPKLLMSGGQGPDESCPEAEAMRRYALEKGIPDEHILVESASTSTLENIRFSKELMTRDFGEESYKCIFVTNNYHVFRAGIIAQKAGLKIDGIGSKTALYYLFNAVLREYIAYLYIHRWWNVLLSACALLVGCGVALAIEFLL
ncbi:MAG: YdcF family protein [Coriobacteriia bacterium]|nr:YdcF family protein [Coriobacteriia bacterium]